MLLKDSLRLTTVRRITVHCPVSRDAWDSLQAGDSAQLEREPDLAPLFDVLRAHEEFGALGPYRSVFEIGRGRETFTPRAGSRPTLGSAGEVCRTYTIVITTYVAERVADARFADLIAALARAHPWELPVIEVSSVRILGTDTP